MTDVSELFVGQVIALLPEPSVGHSTDPQLRAQVSRLFPRAVVGAAVADKPEPPQVFSLFLNTGGGGVLTAAGVDIPVAVLPLDETTPSSAPAFVVTAIAGRSLYVKGAPEGVE